MYTEDQRELDEKIFATLGSPVAHALADSVDARISAIKSKYISLENHLPFELAIFNYAAWLLEPRIVAENEQNVLRLPIVLGLWGESLIS